MIATMAILASLALTGPWCAEALTWTAEKDLFTRAAHGGYTAPYCWQDDGYCGYGGGEVPDTCPSGWRMFLVDDEYGKLTSFDLTDDSWSDGLFEAVQSSALTMDPTDLILWGVSAAFSASGIEEYSLQSWEAATAIKEGFASMVELTILVQENDAWDIEQQHPVESVQAGIHSVRECYYNVVPALTDPVLASLDEIIDDNWAGSNAVPEEFLSVTTAAREAAGDCYRLFASEVEPGTEGVTDLEFPSIRVESSQAGYHQLVLSLTQVHRFALKLADPDGRTNCDDVSDTIHF